MYGEVLASYEAIFDYMEKFMYLMNWGKSQQKKLCKVPIADTHRETYWDGKHILLQYFAASNYLVTDLLLWFSR